ncbi:MAG: ABC transporter permease [Candidatus Brocadiae bacterium]|nr:ABC transporter permease [Candidatus Brocadiia bacterium]
MPYQETIIEAGQKDTHYLEDLYHYRELFYLFAWRDISVRYKQTVLGIAWAIIRPLLTMVVFSIVFGKLARLPSEGNTAYPILVFSALLPWHFFASSLQESSNSLVSNEKLISKVYFPRMIIPASSVIVSFVDFLFAFLVFSGIMVYYRFLPDMKIFLLPLFMGIAFISSLGMGLLVGSLNVKYRDFRHVIPFIIQVGLYISPVGFSTTLIPEKYRILYSLNPMVGIIDGFRWCILGTSLRWESVWISLVISILIFTIGFKHFRKTENYFADLI